MRFSHTAVLSTASFGSLAAAVVNQQCPTKDSSICYSLNVPDTTASSGSGDIFFQISAPTTYSWVALGQGGKMAGANMFLIYASADGQNVTLSPRLGKGNVMPLYNEAADVSLLEGSGISNGMMTANVRCGSCSSWTGGSMDLTSASTKWIYAAKKGDAIDSDDMEESLNQHNLANDFTWDLTTAKGGNDVNPFVGAASNSGSGTATSSPQSTATSSPSVDNAAAKVERRYGQVVMAHAIMAAVAFIFIFPIGAILVRVASFAGLHWVHAAIQVFGLLLFTAAVGCGIWMGVSTEEKLIKEYHPIIGLVLFGMLVFQPVLGLLHHRTYKKTGRRGVFSFAHLGIGRIAVILGIVNGGLGIMLAGDAPRKYIIAYSVVGGVMGLAYIAAIIFGEAKRSKDMKRGIGRDGKGSDRDYSMESSAPMQQR